MNANRQAAVARIHASEHGLNVRAGEPGHVSVNGVSLRAYNSYLTAKGLPLFPEPPKDAAENDPTVTAAADWLSTAIGYSPDISVVSDEELAFFDWYLLAPIRFDDLPIGIDYLVADGCWNRGVGGYLNDLRQLFEVHGPIVYWRMDDALLAAIVAAYTRNPTLLVWAICNARWAKMMANADFLTPSIVPGHLLGEGRARRMSDVHRGAMEMLGWPAEANVYAMPALTLPQVKQ